MRTPVKVTREQNTLVRRMKTEGEPIASIPRATGFSRVTIYRVLDRPAARSETGRRAGPGRGPRPSTRPAAGDVPRSRPVTSRGIRTVRALFSYDDNRRDEAGTIARLLGDDRAP